MISTSKSAKRPSISLSIVFPCLNEEATIGSCVEMAWSAISRLGCAGQVLVVDNGSKDRSVEIAKERGAEVLIVTERGYGSALRAGIAGARYEWLVMLDADMTYDLDSLEKFLEAHLAGADLVIGDRFAGGIDPKAMPIANRYIGNPLLSWCARRLYGLEIRDFHCGLRSMRVETIRELSLKSNGMEFASEMIAIAAMKSLDIREVPVRLHRCPVVRVPHLRRLRDGGRHLAMLVSAAPRRVFRALALMLGIPGALAMIVTGFGPVTFNNQVTFELGTTIVGAMAFVVAIQIDYLGEINDSYQRLVYGGRSMRVRKMTPKWSVALGAFAVLVGLCGLAARATVWARSSLGPLDTDFNQRWLVFACTALMLGITVLTNELLLRIFGFVKSYRSADTQSTAPTFER